MNETQTWSAAWFYTKTFNQFFKTINEGTYYWYSWNIVKSCVKHHNLTPIGDTFYFMNTRRIICSIYVFFSFKLKRYEMIIYSIDYSIHSQSIIIQFSTSECHVCIKLPYIYIMCVCLRIVVFNTYCVMFSFLKNNGVLTVDLHHRWILIYFNLTNMVSLYSNIQLCIIYKWQIIVYY
jgi:hypothetical protein